MMPIRCPRFRKEEGNSDEEAEFEKAWGGREVGGGGRRMKGKIHG